MSAPMKKHRTKDKKRVYIQSPRFRHVVVSKDEVVKKLWKYIKDKADAEKVFNEALNIIDLSERKNVSPDEAFKSINEKLTKPGALLRGIRLREGLTQAQMAEAIDVKQGDISAMEHGRRKIGPMVAKRIEEKFGTNYRNFLE